MKLELKFGISLRRQLELAPDENFRFLPPKKREIKKRECVHIYGIRSGLPE